MPMNPLRRLAVATLCLCLAGGVGAQTYEQKRQDPRPGRSGAGPAAAGEGPMPATIDVSEYRTCIHLPLNLPPPDRALIERGLERLQGALKQPVDIMHEASATLPGVAAPSPRDESHRAKVLHDMVVRVLPFAAGAPDQPSGKTGATAPDDYMIRTAAGHPLVVEIAAAGARGMLFGLYRLASLIEARKNPNAWAVTARPRVARRLALLPPSTAFGRHFQPGLFWRSLDEFPQLGLNGILIIPARTHGTPAGMEALPFHYAAGRLTADETALRELRDVLQRVKTYGQDIYILCSPMVPSQYTRAQARDYYDGKHPLAGYEAAVAETYRDYLSTLFSRLPEVDGIVFHSLELEDLWEGAVSIFPCQDWETGRRVFEAYLTALEGACRARGKVACCWTHVASMDGAAITRLREVLMAHPEVVDLEDAYWPNAGWPFLPFMGYLPEATRRNVCQRGRLGVFLTTTDGEYYGAGKLPVAYVEPSLNAAREAVKRNAEMVIVRLNEHDETTLGTLFSSTAALAETAARSLWDPAPAPSEIYLDCIARLYGADAAPAVARALGRSGAILRDGLTCGDLNLLDHEGINPYYWITNGPAFRLFRKPGTPLVTASYEQLRAMDLLAWQVKTKAIRIEDFRAKLAAAKQAARQGLADLSPARGRLAKDDDKALTGSFENAQAALEAIGLLGEAAYQANLVLDNYAGAPAPAAKLKEAIAGLRSYADKVQREQGPDFLAVHDFIAIRMDGQTHAGPSMPLSLRFIAGNLESLADDIK